MLLTGKHINGKRGGNKGYREKAKRILRGELYFCGYYITRIKKKRVKVFATLLANINKALRLKYRPSLTEIRALLPDYYYKYINVFNPDKADKLFPHRPGINY